MAMAGIDVSDVMEPWNNIKKLDPQNSSNNIRYIIFKLNKEKNPDKVVVEKLKTVGESSHEDLLNDLPDAEPRYIACNLDYENQEGGTRSKLVLIFWCPEQCSPRFRMVSASTFEDVKRRCPGGAKTFQIQTKSECDFEHLKDELKNVK